MRKLSRPPVVQIVEIEHLFDLSEREADALAAQDEHQSRPIAQRIDSRLAAALWADQVFGFVESDGPGGDAELFSKVADRKGAHDVIGAPDVARVRPFSCVRLRP